MRQFPLSSASFVAGICVNTIVSMFLQPPFSIKGMMLSQNNGAPFIIQFLINFRWKKEVPIVFCVYQYLPFTLLVICPILLFQFNVHALVLCFFLPSSRVLLDFVTEPGVASLEFFQTTQLDVHFGNGPKLSSQSSLYEYIFF